MLAALPTAAFTSNVPGLSAAVTSVHVVDELQLTDVAAALPNLNTVAPAPGAKPLPVTVTAVPPAFGPELGLRLVIVGLSYLKWSCLVIALVPLGVLTVMSVVAEVPAGETAVIELAEFTVKLLAGIAPKLTAPAPVKLVPVIVTLVPPAAGPLVGLTLSTEGGGR